MLQKCRDQRKEVFACFINYEKAFDRVQHTRLVELLCEVGVDDKDVRIIKNLYWRQHAEVRVGKSTTTGIEIQRGVRQGCILSPFLFNLYADRIFKEPTEELDLGVKINGVPVSTIEYAYDAVVLSENIEDFQLLLNKISQIGIKAGLINSKNKIYGL